MARFRFARVTASLLLLLLSPATASAGAWTTEEGVVWFKVALLHLTSHRIFVDTLRADSGETCGPVDLELGQRAPYDCTLAGGGGLITTQLFFEAAIGIHERVDLRIQVPYILDAQFASPFTPLRRSGLGDIRLGAQVLLLREPVVWSFNAEVKAPTGLFTPDAVGVPLGEGQWDLTFRSLLSQSFFGGRAWGGVELGYRVRLPNSELGIAGLDVGDELLAVAEGGYRPLAWLYLPLRWEMQWGFASTEQRAGLPDRPGRRVMYLQSGVMLNPLAQTEGELDDLGVELGVRVPLWGQGWPADPVFFVGINGALRVFDPESG